MSEKILTSALEESVRREWLKYSEAEEHKFSLRHRRAVKRIFRSFKRKTSLSVQSRPKRFTMKLALVFTLLIFLAAAAGCTAAYFISKSFRGDVQKDFTEIFPINVENCPETIVQKYCLSELPQGFEVTETTSFPFYEYTALKNDLTGQEISLKQYVKSKFSTKQINTENQELEEIEINGHFGLCINFSKDNSPTYILIWDNEDYILELLGNLSKNELIKLAESARILEN